MTGESDRGGSVPAEGQEGGAPDRNPLRRLYHWVLSWADRPSGPAALFGIAAVESVFFPVPPDVLLIPLGIGKPKRALWFAFLCTAGSLAGAAVGYWFGSGLYESVGRPILEMYGYSDVYGTLGTAYRDNLVLTLGTAGFTPIPYKVFTIAAGGFQVPVVPFLLVSAVSRGARFFLVAALIRLYGEPVRDFIERYFNLLTILLVILVVLGFVAVRWLF
ncbi:MAG: YqaA family protein [Gemmatimonadota bacterium]